MRIGGWPDDSLQPAVNNHAKLSAPKTGDKNTMYYHGFRGNAVRLRPDALAYNLGNFLRFLALLQDVDYWPTATLLELLIKIGARVVRHDRCIAYPQGEVAISRTLLADIRRPIYRLRSAPLPSRQVFVHKQSERPDRGATIRECRGVPSHHKVGAELADQLRNRPTNRGDRYATCELRLESPSTIDFATVVG